MAEWLGTGLQNRLQQFDSAWYLQSVPPSKAGRYFYPLLTTPAYSHL